jgi:hypothetical protein
MCLYSKQEKRKQHQLLGFTFVVRSDGCVASASPFIVLEVEAKHFIVTG